MDPIVTPIIGLTLLATAGVSVVISKWKHKKEVPISPNQTSLGGKYTSKQERLYNKYVKEINSGLKEMVARCVSTHERDASCYKYEIKRSTDSIIYAAQTIAAQRVVDSYTVLEWKVSWNDTYKNVHSFGSQYADKRIDYIQLCFMPQKTED